MFKQEEVREARGRAYAIKDAEPQGPNVVTGTFLLNNCYASVLFDSGLIGVLWTLNLLVKHDAIIVYGEKVVHIPYGNETLIVESDKDMPVIRDFLEVFPDDLSGLPPSRQVEFRIDLVSGDAPVTHALYRLEPSEITLYGQFDFQVTPFGLTNTPAVFMDLMNRVCKPYLDKFIIVFIDAIFVYSKDKEEHGKHLNIILELLKKERLYTKFFKCSFWLDSVQFLGHMIDRNGVHVDPAKIEAIRNWAAPATLTEVRQFLGLFGYYRRLIEGFYLISKPLTKLTQNDKKYEWGKEEGEAFQLLKQKLCSALILPLPERMKDFVVYCDASLKGYRDVLMQ
nr:putative reverse transcriptase domain-containing protein [Tanacetum cinerariifolium]